MSRMGVLIQKLSTPAGRPATKADGSDDEWHNRKPTDDAFLSPLFKLNQERAKAKANTNGFVKKLQKVFKPSLWARKGLDALL